MPCITVNIIEPGELEITNLTATQNEYEIGKNVVVKVTVKNTGGTLVTKTLSIYVNGTVATAQQIYLAPGQEKTYDMPIPTTFTSKAGSMQICADIK